MGRRSSQIRKPEFQGPKSMCICNHTGDGTNSQHADAIQHGHGACKEPGCPCQKFTWKDFTLNYKLFAGIRD